MIDPISLKIIREYETDSLHQPPAEDLSILMGKGCFFEDLKDNQADLTNDYLMQLTMQVILRDPKGEDTLLWQEQLLK